MPEQPIQQPPPVQKIRLRYAKRGRLRFTSHRDFSRAFERALVRAKIPMAYSSGFNPHPRISYANASPTGAASEAEYAEIGLASVCDPGAVREALDEALPEGLDIVDAMVSPPGSLADGLEASQWQVRFPGMPPKELAAAVAAFCAEDSIEVERMTKRGPRVFDCRAAVVTASVSADESSGEACAILTMVVRHETPSVRPDDVLVGIREIAGLSAPVPPVQTRLAQGPLDPETGAVGDPFDVSRETP